MEVSQISREWDGKLRLLFQRFCLHCNKEFWFPKHQKTKFCSRECSHKFYSLLNSTEIMCAWCNNNARKKNSQLKGSKSKIYFCSRKCKDSAQRIGGIKEIMPPHFGKANGNKDYRQRALTFYGKKCNRCGYDKIKGILQVHHKDRNRQNSDISNLEVLCPNCHLSEHYFAHDGIYHTTNSLLAQ